MERTILHIDLNNFYASVECLYNTELREVPMCVAGSIEERRGIILAKNNQAKRMGVATGEPIWKAREKCANLVVVKPNYDRYMKYSKLAKAIYMEYTDQVESFGLDECWLDVTKSQKIFGSGEEIAEEIGTRMKEELGLTVSIGVSFNKIFAKLGSDMKKPDAITVLSRDNYKEKIYDLPVDELLMVGRATKKKMYYYGINTIGDLCSMDREFLVKKFGKVGSMLHSFALGEDNSPVKDIFFKREVKSIGNSTTTKKNVENMHQASIVTYKLCESIATRLRNAKLKCRGIHVTIRYSDLERVSMQKTLPTETFLSSRISGEALKLIETLWDQNRPLRSIAIKSYNLMSFESEQVSLFNYADIRSEKLETTIDALRNRFGNSALSRCIMLDDLSLSSIERLDDQCALPLPSIY